MWTTYTLNILEVSHSTCSFVLKVVHMLRSFYFGYFLHKLYVSNSLVMSGLVVMRGG